MNIVWIMADHFRADALGVLGHPVVHTPCLDALASRGMVFENTFVQSPLCCPSRASIFSSSYVHTHGVWWNGIPVDHAMTTFPEVLRQHQYHTGIVGKLHFYPQDRPHGFEHRELHEEGLANELSAYAGFLASQHPPAQRPARNTTWDTTHPKSAELGVCAMPEEQEETRWVADRARDFIQAHAREPFFLYASFIRPHCPWNPLQRFLDRYADTEIDLPEFDRAEWDQLPSRVRANAESWGWDELGPDDVREMRRHYYALCSQVDENVGRIVDAIEEAGLREDTIIVFTADHGDFMGEHGAFHKMHLWDGSLHVPLIIFDPRREGGIRYQGLVESIDVVPTLLEMLGITPPADMQGQSVAPIFDDPTLPHKDAVFAEYAHHTVIPQYRKVYDACVDLNSVSIRTAEWKYIHYPGEAGELYDIRQDPRERHNRYHDPALLPIRQELTERLLDWRVSLASAGYAAPEPTNNYFRWTFKRDA